MNCKLLKVSLITFGVTNTSEELGVCGDKILSRGFSHMYL